MKISLRIMIYIISGITLVKAVLCGANRQWDMTFVFSALSFMLVQINIWLSKIDELLSKHYGSDSLITKLRMDHLSDSHTNSLNTVAALAKASGNMSKTVDELNDRVKKLEEKK